MSVTSRKRRLHPRRKSLCWWIVVIAAPIALLVIGLTVGLGVGISQNHKGSGTGGGGSSASPTPYPTPPSTSNGSTWQPAVSSSWQIVLENPLALNSSATSTAPDVEIFDIDLFENTNDTIHKLHQLGKKVICYFSAGSYEPNRPDSSQFQASDMGKQLDGWPGERWLNLNSSNVRNIMAARIALASQRGCDAVDPDNIDGYNNDNGLSLTEQDSINFLQALSTEASSRGLSIGLKNGGGIVSSVLNLTNFAVNEQCVQYAECETFAPFIAAGKPVFHIEYPKGAPGNVNNDMVAKICSNAGEAAGSNGFSTVLKDMSLDGWVQYCDGIVTDTPLSQ